jgi:mono/diheme cytochrome c family protein
MRGQKLFSTKRREFYFIASALLWTAANFFLAACSLAGDVTPPPGFEQVTAPPAVAVAPAEVGFPSAMPSAVEGARLYAENCTRCHGPTGGGDGEMKSQIQFPIPAFNTPDRARQATPARWFAIITNGNLERLMPPWGDTFTAAERWDLVAYLYTLSASKSQLEAGQKIYAANCASCHGDGGRGDGPKATGSLLDFTNQQYMATTSNEEFFQALTTAPHNTLTLSEDEQGAVVNYIRGFSFTYADLFASGTIIGKVTNGTAGAATPADLPVALRTFDNFQPTDVLTSTVQSDGTFTFADVDLPPGRAFIVSAQYGDVVYTSDVGQVTLGQTRYDLPLQIFETTTDPSAIQVERLSIALNFQTGQAQVAEHFIISNIGDKTIVAATVGGPTFSAALPAGYSSLTFQDGGLGDRYLQTADGFADTSAIRPGIGAQRILLSFVLPSEEAFRFAQTMSYSTAVVNVLLPANGATLTGPGLSDAGVREVDTQQFQTFTASNLQAGQPLAFELSGMSSSAPSASVSLGDNRNLIIGALALALAVAGVAYWWVTVRPAAGRRQLRGADSSQATPAASTDRVEQLLDELADLDLAFEAGKYPEADYRARRAKLKKKLKALLEKDD